MISVLIDLPPPGAPSRGERPDQHRDEVALAVTLAALVPAAAQGWVREVVVSVLKPSDGVRKVADAVGCRLIEGDRRAGLAGLRGEWALVLAPGMRIEPDWTREAQTFLDRAGPADAAVFRLSVDRFGLKARLTEWRLALTATLPGLRRRDAAVLARVDALRAGRPLRLRRIRARIDLPDPA